MFSTLLAAPSEPAEHTTGCESLAPLLQQPHRQSLTTLITGTPKEGLGVKRYLAASIVCMCIQIPELESVLLEVSQKLPRLVYALLSPDSHCTVLAV